MSRRAVGERLVMSPMEPLVAGGAVFARNQIVFEPPEISQSDDGTVKYHTWLDPRTSLEDLSVQLMEEGAGGSPWPGSIKNGSVHEPER